MRKSQIVKESYKLAQGFRIFACACLIIHNIACILQTGYFRFLKYNLKFLETWTHNFEIFFFLILVQETYINAKVPTIDFDRELQENFLSHLQSTLLALNFLTTVPYWLFRFEDTHSRPFFEIYVDCYLHSVPLILLVIELFINKMLIRKKHLKFTIMFFWFYGFVNLVFTFFEGTPVYTNLSFTNFTSIIFVLFAFATCLIGFVLFWLIQRIKFHFVQSIEKID